MLEQSLPCIPLVENNTNTYYVTESLESKQNAYCRGEIHKHRRVVTWSGEGPIPEDFPCTDSLEDYHVNDRCQKKKTTGLLFYWKQTEALFVKSFHFQRRQKVELLLNILAPLIILAVLYGISKLADSIMHDTEVKYEAKDVGYFIPQFRNPYYISTNNEFLVSQPSQGESAGSISYPSCDIFSNPSQCALLATEKNGQANINTPGFLSEFTLQPFVGDNPRQFLVYGNFSQFRGNTSEMLKYLSYYEAAELYGHNLIDYALSVHTNDKESNGTLRSGESGRQDIIQILMSDNPGSLGFDGSYYAAFAFRYINTQLENVNSTSRISFTDSFSSFWKRTTQNVLSTIGFGVNIFYNAILTETMDYYEYNSCTRGNCQLVASIMRLSDAFYRYTFGRNSSAGILSTRVGDTVRTGIPPNFSVTNLTSSLSHLNYSNPNVSSLLLGSNLTQSERYQLTNRLPYHVANLLMPMGNGVPAIKNYLDIYGMIAIALLLHFLIPSYMRTLVYERTSGLRVLMKMMGLQTGVYWLVTYLFMLSMFMLFCAIIIVLGIAFGIAFFRENNPMTYIGLFFVWGNTSIAFSMFLSSFLRNPSEALMLGWTYVIVVNFMGFLYITKLVKYHASETLMNLTSILPSFAFLRALYYIGKANEAGFAVSLSGPTGMCKKPMPCCTVMAFLAVEWILFFLLGIYIDLVFPQQGYRKHPLFFLGFPWFRAANKQRFNWEKLKGLISFCWRRKESIPTRRSPDSSISSFEHTPSDLSSPRKFDSNEDFILDIDEVGTPSTIAKVSFPLDVLEEQRQCYRGILNAKPGVYLFHLRKEYHNRNFVLKERVHVALNNLSLAIPIGSCVGMLGRNGAGKTTTVSIMSGLFPPTSGQACLGGYSVWKDMQQINLLTGVCPQHSILWNDLTAEEHLQFYARLKGGGRNIKKRVYSLLESVGLYSSRKQLVGKFSGGMKRRLSVAIAFAGDPEIVFLDEPSTGLDPLSKHALWKFIEEQKPGRAILLTTHAMDEAERLCDKIGLVSRGTLLCIGDPESLKNRLGIGYRIEVTIENKRQDQNAAVAKDLLLRLNRIFEGKVELNRNINGHLIYSIPRSVVRLSKVFTEVAKLTNEFPIRDWAVSSSTLEDVFVRVVSSDTNDFLDDFQESLSNSSKYFRGHRQRTVSSPIA